MIGWESNERERRAIREKEDAESRADEAERKARRYKDEAHELDEEVNRLRNELSDVYATNMQLENRITELLTAPDVTSEDVVAALDLWFHQVKSPGLATYLNNHMDAFKQMTAILENDRKRQRENL